MHVPVFLDVLVRNGIGQVQSKPRVQPVPARDAIAARDGIAESGTNDETVNAEGIDKIRGRASPLGCLSGEGGILDLERWRRHFRGGEQEDNG